MVFRFYHKSNLEVNAAKYKNIKTGKSTKSGRTAAMPPSVPEWPDTFAAGIFKEFR